MKQILSPLAVSLLLTAFLSISVNTYGQDRQNEALIAEMKAKRAESVRLLEMTIKAADGYKPANLYQSGSGDMRFCNYQDNPVATVLIATNIHAMSIKDGVFDKKSSLSYSEAADLTIIPQLVRCVQVLTCYNYKVIFRDYGPEWSFRDGKSFMDMATNDARKIGAQKVFILEEFLLNLNELYLRNTLIAKMIDVNSNHVIMHCIDLPVDFVKTSSGLLGSMMDQEAQNTLTSLKTIINEEKRGKAAKEWTEALNSAVHSVAKASQLSYFELRNLKGKTIELLPRKVKYPYYTLFNEDDIIVYNPSITNLHINGEEKAFQVFTEVGRGKGGKAGFEMTKTEDNTAYAALILKLEEAPKEINGSPSQTKYDFTTTFASSQKNVNDLLNIPPYDNSVVYFELDEDCSSIDDLYPILINNAISKAFEQFPFVSFISGTRLSQTKRERGLLKSDDMIDTQTVIRIAADAGKYLLNIANLSGDGANVSFSIELIETQTGEIIRSVPVNCHVTRLEEVLMSTLPIALIRSSFVKELDGKRLSILSETSLIFNPETMVVVSILERDTNPITGETLDKTIDVAYAKYIQCQGQQHLLSINKVIAPRVLNNIQQGDEIYIRLFTEEVSHPEKTADKEYDDAINNKKKGSFGNFLKKAASGIQIQVSN